MTETKICCTRHKNIDKKFDVGKVVKDEDLMFDFDGRDARVVSIWTYFWFSTLFILDVILLAYDFYVGKIVRVCFDGFYMGMLFMIALDWWIDNVEK